MTQIIPFSDMNIEVSQDDYIGEWQAWEAGTYDCDCDQDGFFVCCIIGSGSTMLEAIADFNRQYNEK